MSHGNNNVIGSFQGDLHRDTCNVMTNVMTHCLDSSYVLVRLIRRKVIIIRLTQSFDDHRNGTLHRVCRENTVQILP